MTPEDAPSDGVDDTLAYLWFGLFLIEGLIACIPAALVFDAQSTEFALFVVVLMWLSILGLVGGAIAVDRRWPLALQRLELWVRRGRMQAGMAIGGMAALIAGLITVGWLATLGSVRAAEAMLGASSGDGLFVVILLLVVGPFVGAWLYIRLRAR